jgi:hypothetical protein
LGLNLFKLKNFLDIIALFLRDSGKNFTEIESSKKARKAPNLNFHQFKINRGKRYKLNGGNFWKSSVEMIENFLRDVGKFWLKLKAQKKLQKKLKFRASIEQN